MNNRIREIREEKGLSQADLAEQVGMTVSSVSRHESGDRGLSQELCIEYARALDVQVVELFVGVTSD